MNRLLIGIGALGAAVLTGCATIDRSETESLSDIASKRASPFSKITSPRFANSANLSFGEADFLLFIC